ncbi:integrase family protein [Thioalkalivibrio sp. K90mix]|uniref:tyrosine-type recombinase/integrase n=1 Tax=Thioalkalivibrio sp. (strain K90mix) TaxID=396595 RepID=UPI000195A455|nr:tyrosine-type recombinase/integrase [Thioalkalivibrio sp. K90mix]ADC71736.1 integrase family protein [Thioalkalivibrio sp. K90mix]
MAETKKLTKRVCDAATPPEKGTTFIWDSAVAGFGLRVTAAGAKAFVWQGRVNGRSQRLTIGKPGALTVEKARAEAKRIAGEVASGKDPRAEKHARKVKALTLREAVREYRDARHLADTTRDSFDRAMKALSDWMARPVTEITRDMVARRHRKLGEDSPAFANLAFRYLRAVLNHASEAHAYPDGRPLLPDNPVKRLSATKAWYRVDRRRTYIERHELRPWMQAVQGLAHPPEREPGEGKTKPKLRNGAIARDVFMVLVLTGLRRNEALGLRWEDVSFAGRTLTIPDPKNYQPHTLPLSDYLVELLKARQQESGGEYVFSDAAGTRFQNLRYAVDRVAEVSGVRAMPHDLRRTFATVAESLDVPAYAVKALLNHKTTGDVTAGYIQMTPERLRGPMQRITDFMLAAGGLRDGADVVPLGAAEARA